jgi:hypothetical protein
MCGVIAASHMRRSLCRLAVLGFAVAILHNVYNRFSIFRYPSPAQDILGIVSESDGYPKKSELENWQMTEKQCRSTFPGLMNEIDEAVSRGPFHLERNFGYSPGLVQGRIEDGKVCLSFQVKSPGPKLKRL